ncbi:hypothetical protein T265_07462 [Opisthorchis viverrini]|uniref:G-protein coupled receptors family 1 profile domain-containing protein n=1 Tax=Opisthorchis viverrini TaxID=6198 RepID=A0A074ZCJ4_OPIVI|nr:hypothetical protein T265_07462 [Opisthorchis viverrini]KER25011.1 hypothetical protein T265_07462 [Opisthorchis viverrini]
MPLSMPCVLYDSYSIGPHQTACTLDISRSDRKSLGFLLALTIFGYLIPVGSAILSLHVAWSTVVTSSDREKCAAGKLDVTLMEFLVVSEQQKVPEIPGPAKLRGQDGPRDLIHPHELKPRVYRFYHPDCKDKKS